MHRELFTIDSVLGQEKAKKMLRRAAAGGRLAHAYLFRGPAGVGKKSLARSFGNFLNCLSPAGNDACTNCNSCRKLKSGNHPDRLLIEPDGVSIKIDQIRELKKALAFPPYEAKYRVVLISDVHTMRREAANSLLKVLEEPPAGNLLILTGDEASEILPTITSRCQIITCHGLDRDTVINELKAGGINKTEAETLAAITNGSLGQARLIAETELLPTRKKIIARLLETGPGLPDSAEIVFNLASLSAGLSDQLPDLLELLRSWFRDLIFLSQGLPDRMVNQDLQEISSSVKSRWAHEGLMQRLKMIDKASMELARNCNRTLVCEVLYFGLL